MDSYGIGYDYVRLFSDTKLYTKLIIIGVDASCYGTTLRTSSRSTPSLLQKKRPDPRAAARPVQSPRRHLAAPALEAAPHHPKTPLLLRRPDQAALPAAFAHHQAALPPHPAAADRPAATRAATHRLLAVLALPRRRVAPPNLHLAVAEAEALPVAPPPAVIKSPAKTRKTKTPTRGVKRILPPN